MTMDKEGKRCKGMETDRFTQHPDSNFFSMGVGTRRHHATPPERERKLASGEIGSRSARGESMGINAFAQSELC